MAKVREFFGRITWIQRKIHDRKAYRDWKLVLLQNYWEKTLKYVQFKANQLKNENIMDQCIHITKVLPEIKDCILRQYLSRNQFLCWIHFYKSRIINSEHADEGEINLQVFKLLKFMSDQFCSCKKSNILKPNTIKHGFLSEKELDDLDFQPSKFFNDFKEIAWIDPWFGVQPSSEKKGKK